MSEQRYFWNLLRVVSPKPDDEVKRLEDLYQTHVSEADTPEENLILMISKIIYVAEMLATCVRTDNASDIVSCQRLIGEIRRHERLATSSLVEQAPNLGNYIFKIVMRFPSRMERIAISLHNIVDCCSTKAAEGFQFSEEAQDELSEIFTVTVDMLKKLRDTLVVPNKFLLGQIKFDGRRLEHLVEGARLANWERMEARVCRPQEASVYVEMLDCLRSVNEYIGKMSESLFDLARLEPNG